MTKDDQKISAEPVFFVDGRTVNGKGQEVNARGQVIDADPVGTFTSWEADRLSTLLDAVRESGETSEETLTRVLEDLGTLQGEVDGFPAKVEKMTFALSDQGRAYQEQVEKLTADLNRLQGQQEGREGEWAKQRDGLLSDIARLADEKKALEAHAALPADALERIKRVPKVADALAQPILDALTAPAQEG